MLNIGYESSDDDEEEGPAIKAREQVSTAVSPPQPAPLRKLSAQPNDGPVAGPTQGPIASPNEEADPADDAAPGSPYATTRSLIRNLTLPTIPNFNIPASPPGSPPLRPTKKFTQFLELKKKGQHFNQRLENSSVLRDPGHLQRLMDFAGVTEEEQYASTLPEDVAVPTNFPEWAYVEELRASQKKILKAKEEEKARVPREAIDFVPAAKSGASSSTGTPSGRGVPQSAAERVMEGLTRERKPSPSLSQGGPGKRKELEQRGGRSDYPAGGRRRSRSRSPKRRRSRSR